jgi:hypothetical protein
MIRIWATNDGVRVNPETGRYLEDRPDIHADYPTGDYRERNAVWDARERRVSLRAARNEFIAFQVVIETDGPVAGVRVELADLRGPGGARITAPQVTLFRAWYVKVTQPSTGYEQTSLGPGWYADALIPATDGGGSALAFDLPDARNGIGDTQRNQTVWVDIFIPRDRADAPSGKYTGTLGVTARGSRQEIAVELDVWDFALPDQVHCRGDIWNGSIKEMPPDVELRYYQLAHQHRFQPGVYAYRPDVQVDGTRVTIDWTGYDGRLRKYLDGSAFAAAHGYWGPGVGVPLGHILLPFNGDRPGGHSKGWPISMPEGGPTPDYEAVWVETARQLREHFDADPLWRPVEKVAFINALDESYNQVAYEKMVYFCELLRRGLGEGWFTYRIDGGYSWRAMDVLKRHVTLWLCHTIGFDRKKMAYFRKQGVEPWFYGPMIYERKANSASGSNTYTDLDLFTGRGVGWAAWKHRAGYCEWEFDACSDALNDVHDPETNWTNALNYRRKGMAFNGSGLLIYRGSFIGAPGPAPSVRLKAHRRGFQDYEYFWLLREDGREQEADRIVDSVVHGVPFGSASIGNTEIWRNNPEAWDAARIAAGEVLSDRRPAVSS